MSLTTTALSTTSTSTSTCNAKVYEIPTNDASCAAKLSGNMSTVFDDCCKGDAPVKYNNDCGIYCLAQGQTVEELSSCLMSKSNNYRDVFCLGKQNATATASATTTMATATGTATGTGTTTGTNAAVLGQPVSKAGLGVLAMLVCSVFMGAFA